jgi:hypothetical protein
MSDFKIYKGQETARLNETDLNYLHECYESIAGTDQRIPMGTFLMKSVERAMQQTKPAPINVTETTEYQMVVSRMEDEAKEREKAEATVLKLNDELAERTRQLNEAGIVGKNQLLIDFNQNPEYLEYIENILIIARAKEWAPDMPSLLTRIISEFQDLGYFKLTDADLKIIKDEREKQNSNG